MATRRRRAALAAVALVSLALGALLGGSAAEDDSRTVPDAPSSPSVSDARRRDGATERLSLRQQVGQTLILSFDGTAVPQEVAKALEADEVAGVVLFGGNVESPGQVRDLTDDLQRAAGGGALVSVDQEGGPVRILPFAPPTTGQSAQSTPAEARGSALETAEGLRELGVNVNLAPVSDVPLGPGAALADRAYPGGAGQVSELVRSAVDGYREGGVGATVKHFPGLGAAARNTDDAPVTIGRSRAQLDAVELAPFRAAVEAGAPIVMTSHARFPAYDRRRIASQSSAILDDLLRRRLGFRGAVITDSLEAKASLEASSGSVGLAATRSLEAGADLLLLTGDASYGFVFERLLERARRSRELRARVEAAAERVLRLKERIGLEPPPSG